MTPASLFLSSAGASLTIISSDRLGARPATWPGRRIVGCHLGHGWSAAGRGEEGCICPDNGLSTSKIS